MSFWGVHNTGKLSYLENLYHGHLLGLLLVNYLIQCGFLVSRASDDVLVIRGDVTAKD